MVGPGYVLLAQQFDTSVDTMASAFGSILLGLGCFMLAQNALAAKFGHRIVYLSSVFLMFISCVWCALSPGIASIRASRVFQGFGMSSLQSLVASTIEQIYFIHERGSRNVFWSFAIMSGITLGPLLYSYVIENISWQMGFWFVTIPLGIAVILVFFFVPETNYVRENRKPACQVQKNESSAAYEKRSIEDRSSDRVADQLQADPGISYPEQLRVWNGVFTDESLLKLFLRPFPFLLSPVGLTNLGGLVGIVLAFVISGPLTDWGTIRLSRQNHGIYEPEFRLFFAIAMLFGVFGYAGWAVGTTHNMPWIGAVACIAMANFSMVMTGSAAITYLLDTHGPSALHVLAMVNFLKNMVLYGFTFFANGMIARRGVKTSLLILAGCQAFCWISSIPMYIFGKRARSFVSLFMFVC
ncbi:Quinidine resistance protein 3 [Leucoagaricus sp. SymC.cos]|nr:Quinidine resistance protein 3 [Leucoagaricus sp. SymC.cos]